MWTSLLSVKICHVFTKSIRTTEIARQQNFLIGKFNFDCLQRSFVLFGIVSNASLASESEKVSRSRLIL